MSKENLTKMIDFANDKDFVSFRDLVNENISNRITEQVNTISEEVRTDIGLGKFQDSIDLKEACLNILEKKIEKLNEDQKQKVRKLMEDIEFQTPGEFEEKVDKIIELI